MTSRFPKPHRFPAIEGIAALADTVDRQNAAVRDAFAALDQMPRWNETIRALTASTAALQHAVRFKPELVDLAARFRVPAIPVDPALQETFERLRTHMSVATTARIAKQLQGLRFEAVAVPEVALVEVVAPAIDEMPDGWEALPTIYLHLTPARRRELLLRVVSLLYAAAIYAKVMLETPVGKSDATMGAIIAAAYLYHVVLCALEEAGASIADADDPEQDT